ncbi:MAG: hypothetical protein IKZ28_02000 [Clostridia bacterium]|nr:hypothetical protein [Clostridia bacterium]
MKKKLSGVIALLCATLVCGSSCSLLTEVLSKLNPSSESSVEDGTITFESVSSGFSKTMIAKEETKTVDVNKDITGKNYVKIELETNANLLGAFRYADVNNESKVVVEEFFIEPSNEPIVFKQFLDSYRANGVGLFDKKLLSVSFKNLDEAMAEVSVKGISVAKRDVPKIEKEIYIEKGDLKVGADLTMGGTLSYLERTSYLDENGKKQTVDEIIDKDGNVSIGIGAATSADCQEPLSNSVNLINIYDAGREIQQSYYANVGGTKADTPEEVAEFGYSVNNKPDDYGSNGYDRSWCFTSDVKGYYWPYNPVQGGDEVCNVSQIIDYEITESEIWVKVRAMDWANGYAWPKYANLPGYESVKNGRTTKSYIENRYTIKGNMLYVDNRFVDWNGFENMDKIPEHSLEIPATYIVHPLNNYVCYMGSNPWELADENYVRRNDLGSWVEAPEVNYNPPEEWFAWVNEDDFGVGVYIPNADVYVSGRCDASTAATYKGNKDAKTAPMANEYLYNKKAPTSDYTSCYVGNTCYTAPVVTVTMKEYIPLSYSYVVAVDYLRIMRSNFKELADAQVITNKGLEAWD